MVERAVDSFTEPLQAGEGDLQRRLLSVSGNGRGDYWHVAWTMARDEPLHGTGAGSFEAHWLQDRPISFYARDAHNLYLETLGELGALGLILLVATLALPLAVLPHVRRLRYCPAAAGAFIAYLLHASVDWDWEVPAVTLAALFCAAALLASRALRVADGQRRVSPHWRWRRRCSRSPSSCTSATVPPRRASPRSSVEIPIVHSLRPSGRSTGPHGRTSPGSCAARPSCCVEDDAAARKSLKRALELNPESWSTWLDLAVASRGAGRTQALAQVKRLNPLSQEADELQTEP